jgi:hypothetical protein
MNLGDRLDGWEESARNHLGGPDKPIAEALMEHIRALREAIELGDMEDAVSVALICGVLWGELSKDAINGRKQAHGAMLARMGREIEQYWDQEAVEWLLAMGRAKTKMHACIILGRRDVKAARRLYRSLYPRKRL